MGIRELVATRHVRMAALLTALTTLIVYLPGLSNGFVNWDDHVYAYRNPRIVSIGADLLRYAFFEFHESGNWHPLTTLSHALDFAIWGLRPLGHHLSSIILHCINTFLVVTLVIRLMEARVTRGPAGRLSGQTGVLTAATVTGILFGIHPIHVESVAWISERKDVLYSCFYLLSVLLYLRYANEKKGASPWYSEGRYYGVLALFTLSLMSKPMAVTLPLVLMLIDWYPLCRARRGEKPFALIMEKVPLFLLALASSVLTILAQQHAETVASSRVVPLTARLVNAVTSLGSYLYKIAWPAELTPYYPYPLNIGEVSLSSAEHLPAAITVLAVTCLCIATAKRKRLFSAVWVYFLITLSPVIGIIQVGSQTMADRYAYLPGLGPFLLMGIGTALAYERLSRGPQSGSRLKAGFVAVVAAISVLLAIRCVRQIRIWHDGVSLWGSVVEAFPDTPKAYANRGEALFEKGRNEEALRDYSRAIQLGLRQFDDSVAVWLNARAQIYAALGRKDDALKDFGQAIWMSVKPNPDSYNNRGNIYMELGRYGEALKDYSDAIRVNPSDGGLYFNRARANAKLGRLEDAYEDLTRAVELSPSPNAAYLEAQRLVLENLKGRESEGNSSGQGNGKIK